MASTRPAWRESGWMCRQPSSPDVVVGEAVVGVGLFEGAAHGGQEAFVQEPAHVVHGRARQDEGDGHAAGDGRGGRVGPEAGQDGVGPRGEGGGVQVPGAQVAQQAGMAA
jgi:hypothetical protein